jgi:NADH-quinone oxidoreductase subunit I
MLKNFWITLCYLFKHKVTRCYPEEKRVFPERSRGMPRLLRKPDGSERCIGCGLCQNICPSNVINVQLNDAVSGVNRIKYSLDQFNCISCGLCEEVCPVAAIKLRARNHSAMSTNKERIMSKQQLLEVEA